MPIDFLGRPVEKDKKKDEEAVKWHVPLKEKETEIKKQEPKKKVQSVKKVVSQKAEFKEVNFITGFKRYILKRRLMFSIIFGIIIILVAGGIFVYFYFFPVKPEPEPPVQPSPTPVVSPTPTPSPETPNPSPQPSPSPQISPSPQASPVLPDTELAPIRGSVVKFQGDDTLYLIEDNGELREIDRNTVVFENGDSINDLKPSLIYTIADRFKTVRKGKDVVGQVDWDPRVLIFTEINPFLP